MRKHFIFAFLLFFAIPAMAQLRSHHGGGHQNPNATLTVTSTDRQGFWLFVDDILQNEMPVRSICVRNFWPDDYHIRVELDNKPHNCIGQYVDMSRSQTLSIIQRHNMYGLDFKSIQVRPELTMELITSESPTVPTVMPEPALPPMPAPMPPVPTSMDPKDYDDAYRMISGQSFDNTKLTMAKQVVASNPMTANQILGICKLFSFENNKLEFAKYAYDHCTDKNKYFLLYEAFSYDASKQELNEYIQGL